MLLRRAPVEHHRGSAKKSVGYLSLSQALRTNIGLPLVTYYADIDTLTQVLGADAIYILFPAAVAVVLISRSPTFTANPAVGAPAPNGNTYKFIPPIIMTGVAAAAV